MKKYLLFCLLCTIALILHSQAPMAFNYQAILRNDDSSVKANETVSLQVSIVNDQGASQYLEIHNTQTNEFGLVNVVIGEGTTSNDLSTIDWSAGPYFLDITVNGVKLGSSPLLSVPYAMYSEEARNVFSGNYEDLSNSPNLNGFITEEEDPIFTGHATSGISSTDIANWNSSYGWGDHSGLYKSIDYLPLWGEIINNPFSIDSPEGNQLLRYNSTSSNWENWSPNYLTNFTETDPTWIGDANETGAIGRIGNVGIGTNTPSNLLTNPLCY